MAGMFGSIQHCISYIGPLSFFYFFYFHLQKIQKLSIKELHIGIQTDIPIELFEGSGFY